MGSSYLSVRELPRTIGIHVGHHDKVDADIDSGRRAFAALPN
jgi:hypothetical protein